LCYQPQPKTAILGGIGAITWVDATNIKINPSKIAPLVGVCQGSALSSGAVYQMLIATKILLGRLKQKRQETDGIQAKMGLTEPE
jgi:hypothetical protein